MISRDEFKEICIEILKLLLYERFSNTRHVEEDFIYKELSHRDAKTIRFCLGYLREKGYVSGFDITASGIDFLFSEEGGWK
jgi:hypothetical protein